MLYGRSVPITEGTQTDKRTSAGFPPKITCVRNFRNSFSRKMAVFDFLGCFKKYCSTIILGVRNFRVFVILEHLPYVCHLSIYRLTLKAPITTAADDKFCLIFPNF